MNERVVKWVSELMNVWMSEQSEILAGWMNEWVREGIEQRMLDKKSKLVTKDTR